MCNLTRFFQTVHMNTIGVQERTKNKVTSLFHPYIGVCVTVYKCVCVQSDVGVCHYSWCGWRPSITQPHSASSSSPVCVLSSLNTYIFVSKLWWIKVWGSVNESTCLRLFALPLLLTMSYDVRTQISMSVWKLYAIFKPGVSSHPDWRAIWRYDETLTPFFCIINKPRPEKLSLRQFLIKMRKHENLLNWFQMGLNHV